MSFIDDLMNDDSYSLTGPEFSALIPVTLAMTGGGRGPPNTTLDSPPGSAVPFALGDGVRRLLPVTFSGPLHFDSETERDLFVARMNRAAQGATYMARREKSGPLGLAPGWAEWKYGARADSGILMVTVYPSAQPTSGGILVDW